MNPNQIVNVLMKNNPNIQNNPMMQNAIRMAQQGNSNELQKMAQNIAREKGINLDELVNNVKSKFNF